MSPPSLVLLSIVRDHSDQRSTAAEFSRVRNIEGEQILHLTIEDRVLAESMLSLLLNRIENLYAAAASRIRERVIAHLLSGTSPEYGNAILISSRCGERKSVEGQLFRWYGFWDRRSNRTQVNTVFYAVTVEIGIPIGTY